MLISNETMGQAVTALETAVSSIDRRLAVVEATPRPTDSSVPQPSTGSPSSVQKLSRRARRQARAALRKAAAPPSTPAATSATRIATATAIPPIPKAALEKIVVTLSVPDAVAGHVVGRAGTGLRQIHDISHAKVSVAQTIGPSASRSVTIRGTSREVGDAVSAIGKRIARRRVRQPKPKKKGKQPATTPSVPPTSSSNTPRVPRTPKAPVPSGSTLPPIPETSSTPRAPAPVTAAPTPIPSSSAAASPKPMSVDTSRGSSSTTSSTATPMQVDSASKGKSSSRSSSVQTARRGGGPPSGSTS